MHIDTLSIARDLKAADLPPAQAEAIATAIGQALREGVATKGDIEALAGQQERYRSEAKAESATLRAEMKSIEQTLRAEIERSRNQILVWIIGAQVALSGLTIALVKL